MVMNMLRYLLSTKLVVIVRVAICRIRLYAGISFDGGMVRMDTSAILSNHKNDMMESTKNIKAAEFVLKFKN